MVWKPEDFIRWMFEFERLGVGFSGMVFICLLGFLQFNSFNSSTPSVRAETTLASEGKSNGD